MAHFQPVKLELLRPGPAHNQLLSPLTPYLALCGDSSPVTFQVRYEHQRFLGQLERLRYVVAQGPHAVAVPDRVRETTVSEVGHDVAEIFASIPSLLAEMLIARGEAAQQAGAADSRFLHLSIVLGGSELALIPFELALSPQANPGEGLEFCLQLAMAVVPTRQSRRRMPAFATWDVTLEPKLLVISAAPDGLEVPIAEHLHALRAAMEPWIGWPGGSGAEINEQQRLPKVMQRMRVLANASVQKIQDLCARERFTHVHVLAHGGTYELGGERQFGIVLCDERDPGRGEVVSGKRLAKALQASSLDGAWRSNPFIVTLATCDSGNAGSVLVPGGSIAHDLHNEGIPWVLASQFPLTKAGSVVMAEELYPGLLRGDDPRAVLHELRRKLYLHTQRNHDWASIVAYATVPMDFEQSVATFFEQQARRAIEAGFSRADDLAQSPGRAAVEAQDGALRKVRNQLDLWRSRLPMGDGDAQRRRRAECYGMHGSAFKRMALVHYARGDDEHAVAMMRESLGHYRQAMKEWASGSRYHWVAAQVLSLTAVLRDPPDPKNFDVVLHMAHRGLADENTSEQAWAHGTIAELEMLSLYHKPGGKARQGAASRVLEHCRDIVSLMGPQSFHVLSTRRQFQRYVDFWSGPWRKVAEAAVRELTLQAPGAGPGGQ